MKINRGQVFTIYPNEDIKKIFAQSFGNRRFIYNQLVNISSQTQIRSFIEEETSYKIKSKKGLQKLTSNLSSDYEFLNLSHSQSNQEASHRVAQNWKETFANKKCKPKFKKKHSEQTFFIPNQNNIHIINNKLFIKPLKNLFKKKLGYVPSDNEIMIDMKQESVVQGEITGVTIKKHNNMYTASITYSYENYIERNEYKSIKNLRAVGIDIGLKNKTVDSKGRKSENKFRKEQKKAEETKKQLQKKKSKLMERQKNEIIKKREVKTINQKEFDRVSKVRKKDCYADKIIEDKLSYKVIKGDNKFNALEWREIAKASNKYDKYINILSNKISNITRDDNHKISRYYADNFDIVCMETLNISAMQKLWGKTISSLALSDLIRMIKYKTESQGGIFVQISRWYASTKICSKCNYKASLSLNDREWVCPECGESHDRDVNAGKNIEKEGMRILINEILSRCIIKDWNRISPPNRLEKLNSFLHCA